MVCDYFIERFLEIEHKNGISYFELSFKTKWFPCIDDCYDEAEDSDNEIEVYVENSDYNRVCKEIEELCLIPRKPRVIFKDGKYTSNAIMNKYLPMVLKKVNTDRLSGDNKDTGILKDAADIIKITKRELRYRQHEYFTVHPDG